MTSYTPALFSLSRLWAEQEMGRAGFELHGHGNPLAEPQFLDGTLRHEGREGKPAVNKDAHMEPDGVESRHGALETIRREAAPHRAAASPS